MNNLQKIWIEVKSIFLSGFFTLLPLALTFLIFRTFFRILHSWIKPLQTIQPQCFKNTPYSEFIFILLFIFLIGIILRLFVLDKIIHAIENSIFYRIPILRTVYSGLKQLVGAFSQQDQLTFKKVVLIEFPRTGIYSIGFLTGEFPNSILEEKENTYYNIFIPTTPNPTTGYFVIVKKDSFKEINLTKQEAMSIIISGGIIKPERFMNV